MRKLLFFFLLLAAKALTAQDNAGYKLPPKDIADMLLAKPVPGVRLDSKGEWLLLSERNSYPSVEELAQQEWRIAGLRFNPNNYALSRQNFVNNFLLENIRSGKQSLVSGLPSPLSAGNISWNPGETKIAFTQTSNTRVDLYVIDVATHIATRINQKPLNIILGGAYTWVDDNTLIYKTTLKPVSATPVKPLLPKGPSTQENLGKTAPSRTYEDLIKTPYDEDLFAFYATAQLVKNTRGVETPIGAPSITNSFSISPDKKYALVRTIKRPFSYLVPAYEFSSTVSINDLNGKLIKVLAELPSVKQPLPVSTMCKTWMPVLTGETMPPPRSPGIIRWTVAASKTKWTITMRSMRSVLLLLARQKNCLSCQCVSAISPGATIPWRWCRKNRPASN